MKISVVRKDEYGGNPPEDFYLSIVPRIGETVVLPHERGGERTCTVEDVRHHVAYNAVTVYVR